MKKILKDTHGELRIGFGLLLALVTMYTPVLIIGGISFMLFGADNPVLAQLMMGIAGTPLVVLVTRYLLQKNFKQEHFITFDFITKDVVIKLVKGFIFGALLICLEMGILYMCGFISIQYQGLPIIQIIAGFATFLGMATIEECTSRGIVDSAFEKFGTPVAIICSAIFFTVIHQDLWMDFSLVRMFELFLMGITLSVIMHATRSIAFVTGFHMAINVTSAVIFGYGSTVAVFSTTLLQTNVFTGTADGASGIVSFGLNILFMIGFYLYGRRK